MKIRTSSATSAAAATAQQISTAASARSSIALTSSVGAFQLAPLVDQKWRPPTVSTAGGGNPRSPGAP